MKQKMMVTLMMLGVSFGFALFGAQSASAATITVNSLSDSIADDGQCTLREAMTNAEADDQSGSTDCEAGAGADTINISVAGTINLLTVLPVITTDMTINGSGPSLTTVRRDSNAATEFRIFHIKGGNSTFSGMTVRDGVLHEDATLNTPAPGVLANDADGENNPLTAQLQTSPAQESAKGSETFSDPL